MSLGVYGFGCEDALTHLLNFVWPNVFETSPHLVQAFMDAVDGMRVSLGPIKVLSYVVQVRIIRNAWVFPDCCHFCFESNQQSPFNECVCMHVYYGHPYFSGFSCVYECACWPVSVHSAINMLEYCVPT